MCFREITPIHFTELWAMKGKGSITYLPSNNAECFLRYFAEHWEHCSLHSCEQM